MPDSEVCRWWDARDYQVDSSRRNGNDFKVANAVMRTLASAGLSSASLRLIVMIAGQSGLTGWRFAISPSSHLFPGILIAGMARSVGCVEALDSPFHTER